MIETLSVGSSVSLQFISNDLANRLHIRPPISLLLPQNLTSGHYLHQQPLLIPNQMRRLIQPILALHLPRKLHIKMPQQIRHDQSHLMKCQPHADAISRPHGEGLEYLLLVGGIERSVEGMGGGKPAFRGECGRRAEVEWMMVGCVVGDADFDLVTSALVGVKRKGGLSLRLLG
jgi:hypothetical protein